MMAAKQISSRLLLLLLIISLALRIVGLRDKMLVSPIKLGQWLVGPQVVLVPINFKLDRPPLRLTLALKDKAQTRRLILSQPQL
jgi:hypothetical protein